MAVALGVGVVVWVTCCYESVQRSVTRAVLDWIGRSHIMVEPRAGVWEVFGEELEEPISRLPGIAHTTVRTREYVEAGPPPAAEAGEADDDRFVRIEITGLEPDKEDLFRTHKLAAGRFVRSDDTHAVVIERLLAEEFRLSLNDTILIRHLERPRPVQRFTIVGIIDRRRASVNQAMMTWARLQEVQQVCKLPGKVKAIDIILTDPSFENIQRAAEQVQEVIDRHNSELRASGRPPDSVVVKTTEAQHKKLDAAKGLLQFIMLLLSCVVLLTAFFIILATMSMGVTEQITQLGLLRCLGATRGQLGLLVLLQTVPLGLIGTCLGLPLGLALHWLTVEVSPDYLGELAVNVRGILLAVVGGIGTTVLGASVPALSAVAVSPVEAMRAQPGGRLIRWAWLLVVIGAVLIGGHELMKRAMVDRQAFTFDTQAIVGVVLLYAGAVVLAPVVVMVLGRFMVHVAGMVLRLRPQLVGEEIAKAPFRAGAVCSGLMVALSLIVGLIVWGQSVKQGWQFPKEFPDAMLYSYAPLPLDEVRAACDVPGVKQWTVIDDFPFATRKPSRFGFLRSLSVLDQFSRFLAIEPAEGLAITKLAFIEGDEREAVTMLEQGGHVLVSREFAQVRKKHAGDKVTIWVEGADGRYTKATFRIAAVVASPGLDIAISYFNATTYFQTYAVGAIIGTTSDAQRLFGRRYGKLILINFDSLGGEDSMVHSDSRQAVVLETKTSEAGRPTFAAGPGPIPGDGPEERVANAILQRVGYPPKAFVTARELKRQIDSNINRVTLLLSAIPAVGLVIAALGVANLMAAGVAARSRETAVLRAVGLTKSQMARMVIGEGLVLGLLGSVMGLALGVWLGRTSNVMTELLSGFRPEFHIPWGKLCLGAGLATGLCLLAALIPAWHASRSNIVAALSDA